MAWTNERGQTMTANEADQEDAGVPEQAVEALTAAQRRAIQAGHPVVLVHDGFLVRMDQSGTTVLKRVPEREKVSIRTWTRSHEQLTSPPPDVCWTERVGEDDRQE
jgi:hypothetical protein